MTKDTLQYEEEKRMPFMTTPERIGMEKGLLEGIEVSLDLKFGEEGLKLIPEIKELGDHEVLRAVLQAIKTAASPDDLRRVWTRGRRSKKRRRTR
jgi:hypothetical protein